jgi:hypothetical protein
MMHWAYMFSYAKTHALELVIISRLPLLFVNVLALSSLLTFALSLDVVYNNIIIISGNGHRI